MSYVLRNITAGNKQVMLQYGNFTETSLVNGQVNKLNIIQVLDIL